MSTTVGDSTGYVPNLQMSAFGYVIAAVMIVVLLPVLPVIVIVWILWRLFFAEEPDEPRYESWRAQRALASASSDGTREKGRDDVDEAEDENETSDDE